jgi:hypothetical protein
MEVRESNTAFEIAEVAKKKKRIQREKSSEIGVNTPGFCLSL